MSRDWKETTRQERNLRIFREELDEFLPERILDFHVHIALQGTLPPGVTYPCGGVPLTAYSYEELDGDLAACFPGRKTSAVCFGLPFPSYDREANNRYVAAGADGERFFALRLLDPRNDAPAAVARDIEAGWFWGFKPYPDYARPDDIARAEVDEMLPAWALEIVDSYALVIMLHLPRPGRLADPLNREQVTRLCRRYPRAQVVLAHVGRAYYFKGVEGMLDGLLDLPNLYFDLAMLNNSDVLEYLFRKAPIERILFATDIPIALAPGKSVEINGQYSYVTPNEWDLSIWDRKGKIRYTSFLYEELRAVRKAAERVGLSRTALEGMFFSHGKRLLDGVKVRRSGQAAKDFPCS